MFNKDITVVNKYVEDNTTKYKTTTVKGFWSTNKGITLNDVNLIKNDGLTCRILMSTEGYVKPKEFNGTGWTLRNDDYLIKGVVESVSTIADIKSNYECMKITDIAIKDYGSSDMWHYEISGE